MEPTKDPTGTAMFAVNQLVEQLRYAGLSWVHTLGEVRTGPLGEVCTKTIFDLLPPAGTGDSRVWAKQNAERMTSYGYNAVVAPKWHTGDARPTGEG
jgi:hypothetical protein